MYKIKEIGAAYVIIMMTFGLFATENIEVKDNYRVSLVPGFPIENGYGLHIEAGLLLEQMRFFNAGIAYRWTSNAGTASWEKPTNLWTVDSINFNLDPGLRVGLGCYFDHKEWMLSSNFEWLYSKGSNYQPEMISSRIGVPLFSERSRGITSISTMHCDYYLLDVYFSRQSFVSHDFEMEQLAGIKAAWINYNTRTDIFYPPISEQQVIYQNFWGVGPMAGINLNYYLFGGISVYSDTNLSVLLGNYEYTAGYGLNVEEEENPSAHKCVFNFHSICPTLRSIIGLQFGRLFLKNRHYFSLKVGFDGRYYFNQYPLVFFTEEGNDRPMHAPIPVPGNYGMVGFILVAGWDF